MKGKKMTADEVIKRMEEKYGDAYTCLREVSEKGAEVLEELELPKTLVTQLTELAQKNIKKPIIKVVTIIKLSCFGGEGVNILKEALTSATKNKKCNAHYLGAPNYKLSIVADDYKTAQKEMEDVINKIGEYAKKNNCIFEVEGEAQ